MRLFQTILFSRGIIFWYILELIFNISIPNSYLLKILRYYNQVPEIRTEFCNWLEIRITLVYYQLLTYTHVRDSINVIFRKMSMTSLMPFSKKKKEKNPYFLGKQSKLVDSLEPKKLIILQMKIISWIYHNGSSFNHVTL